MKNWFEIVSMTGAAILIAASVLWVPAKLQTKQALIAPPPKMEYFSFGYQMPIADNLWIRSIQDFDYCETQIAENQCKNNSWLAEMLDTVTTLAPDYKIAYETGGLALTIIISDYAGASKIFDKGVIMFPYDVKLLFRAAYHAIFEEKKPEKAADLLVRAAKVGGQPWYYSLATKLYTEAGKKDLALEVYKDIQGTDVEPGTLKRIRGKLGLAEPAESAPGKDQ